MVTRPQEKSSCIRGHPPSSLSPGMEKYSSSVSTAMRSSSRFWRSPPASSMGKTPIPVRPRELTEETGYKTDHMEKLGYVYTTPGFCNETIHLYLADHLVKSHQHLDPG